jgi:hypothetical protein
MVLIAVEHEYEIQVIAIHKILEVEMPGVLGNAIAIANCPQQGWRNIANGAHNKL